MKQIVFTSRIPCDSEAATPSLELEKIQAARGRHSACGVSSLLVRRGDRLLGVLEGGRAYVDRMWAALAKDGLLDDVHVLLDHPILCREYSEVALSLIEVETLSPRPTWADKDLLDLDLRAAKRVLKSLRAFHGLHTEPARESHLRSVQVGPLRA